MAREGFRVLIFSADPFGAALVGATLELAGFRAAFPLERETPRATLLRVRPEVVLVDCEGEPGCSDDLLGHALMLDACVGTYGVRDNRSPGATARMLPFLLLPTSQEELLSFVEGLIAPGT